MKIWKTMMAGVVTMALVAVGMAAVVTAASGEKPGASGQKTEAMVAPVPAPAPRVHIEVRAITAEELAAPAPVRAVKLVCPAEGRLPRAVIVAELTGERRGRWERLRPAGIVVQMKTPNETRGGGAPTPWDFPASVG